MPVDALSLMILEAGQQRNELNARGGLQPLLPGRAFQLNQVEKDWLRESRLV
jgi:hypothetical protein